MRILFLTSRFPYPLEKGDKLRAFHQVKELSKNHEVILVAVSDQLVLPEHLDALKPYCKKMLVHQISLPGLLRNLLATLFNKLPFQVGYFYSKGFQKKINDVIGSDQPDAIFCQLVRMAEYVRPIKHIPKTLDYMDAFSKGLERLSQRSSFPKKFMVKMEWKRLLRYEEIIFQDFNQHAIISEQDRSLIPHPDRNRIHVIPNGVDVDFYRPLFEADAKKYDLIFSGNMAYPPNVESALFIAKEIMPLLWKKNSGIKLVIAGATPVKEILRLKSENIEVTGWVDDMRTCFAGSKIHLAPMLISIGLQNKILQAMAMKIPCIISTQANNAIHAPVNDCLLIADRPEEYVKKIFQLLNDESERKMMAENAYRFVRENFNWEVQVSKLERILKSA